MIREHMAINAEPTRFVQVKRGLRLEYLTVAWNSLEGLIAIGSGLVAGSIALVGFGFDSVIEVSSGLVLVWRLHSDRNADRREIIERRALKLVGFSFIALAAYVTYDAVCSLIAENRPDESLVGIALAVLSLIVMPLLARAKRRVAARISSRALVADSRQTDLCGNLSETHNTILLCGPLHSSSKKTRI